MKLKIISIFLLSLSSYLYSQEIRSEKYKIISLANQWTEAHNKKDLLLFEKMFDSEVLYYCKQLSKEECIKLKSEQLFSKHHFSMRIKTDISISAFENNIFKCDFIKGVYYKKKYKEYSAYLILKKTNGDYIITGEGDRTTDAKLNFNLNLGKEVPFVDFKATNNSSIEKSESHAFVYWIIGIMILVGLLVICFLFVTPRISKKEPKTVVPENHLPKERKGVVVKNNNDNNLQKGHEFEECVAKRFDNYYFKIITWRSDKTIPGQIPKSNGYPDLEMEFKHNGMIRKFAVECKWRNDFYNNCIDLKDRKLWDYKDFKKEKRMEVFIVIGVGGTPVEPQDIFVIPLDHISNPRIHRNKINNYKKLGLNFFYDLNDNSLR